MATINMLRGVLVAGAALAAVIAAVYGQWVAAFVLFVAVVAHGVLWLHLHRTRARRPQA